MNQDKTKVIKSDDEKLQEIVSELADITLKVNRWLEAKFVDGFSYHMDVSYDFKFKGEQLAIDNFKLTCE
jgi:hypothetical protein